MPHLYHLAGLDAVPTPALVFYPEFIRQNIATTVAAAGGPGRLRPHAKTHKTREVVQLLHVAGVTRHKCATLAEAELLALAGAADVLVAYPLVGPNPARLAALAQKFPGVAFAAVIDCVEAAEALAAAARAAGITLGFFVDLDLGMGRTGCPVEVAEGLYRSAAGLGGLAERGLHAYDGHRGGPAPERDAAALAGLAGVLGLRARLQGLGFAVAEVVAGGTPTFPTYAAARGVPGLTCSPGTFVLHDHGYATRYPDQPDLTPAAALLTRVVSRPGGRRVTFDLGHKALAADPPLERRFHLIDAPPYTPVLHSEEHLVIETDAPEAFPLGSVWYALPGHVCPTVALYDEALVAEGGRLVGAWRVARGRALSGFPTGSPPGSSAPRTGF